MSSDPQPPPAPGDPKLVDIGEQVYRDERPVEHLQRYYDWSMTHRPNSMYTLVRVVTSLYAWTVFRLRSLHTERIPPSGPLIFAANHASNLDHFFLGAATRRKAQFMAKSQLFKGPAAFVYRHGGVFPVRRGFADEESFAIARTILERGGSICLYPEGGRSRTGRLAERAKRGIGRVALETGATIIPVAIHNSYRVRNWKRFEVPRITVLYGDPVRFAALPGATREQEQAVADDVFARIRALHAQLEPPAPAG